MPIYISRFSADISFSIGSPPEGFSYSFDRYLYNETSFLHLQYPYLPVNFYMLHNKRKEIWGRCCFFIIETTAYSPYRSPFGGLELTPKINLDLIGEFIAFIEFHLNRIGAKAIKITQAPFFTDTEKGAKVTNCLLRSGWKIKNPDINHHIVVSDELFEGKIHNMEKRKLAKASRRGFAFIEERIGSIEAIYAFIQHCRNEKGQNLNISFPDLKKAITALPHSYRLFTVTSSSEIIAATIVVLVNAKIAYNFLPASLSACNKWSPMVFLMKNLYEWGQINEIEILDLGISAIDNVPQINLMQFKERVGGEASLKLTFGKEV